jgi:alpha-1,6-mannosyltransferase
MRLAKTELLICLCGLSLVALTAFGLTLSKPVIGQFGIGYGPALTRFVILSCVQGVIYFAAIFLVMRFPPAPRRLWIILGVAALLRVLALSVPPFLSNDLYRYIWDGWVQAAGINPYRYIPADPHLAALRDAIVYPNINRATYAHTIYPPAAEMIYFAITRIVSWCMLPPVLGMKLAMVGLEAIGIWAMLRLLDLAGLPRSRVLIYAWNPVAVWEFAGNGHVDAIAIGFIALALLAICRGKSARGAAALAVAVLAKFLPIVLLPALWRRWDWKFAAVFIGCVILLYVPYLSVGKHVFGFLGGYGAQEGIENGQGLFLLAAIGRIIPLAAHAAGIFLLLLAVLLAGIGGAMVFGPQTPLGAANAAAATRRICQRSLLLGCTLMVGFSPHYPWYYCWLLIPACIAASPCAIYLVAASPLLYLNPTHTRLFWPICLYGPFMILAAWQAWRSRAGTLIALKLVEGDRI